MAENSEEASEFVKAIRRAAVAFANDYGPLPAANRGDEAAQHEVASRLMSALRRECLTVTKQSN